jgi:hypothetical protein
MMIKLHVWLGELKATDFEATQEEVRITVEQWEVPNEVACSKSTSVLEEYVSSIVRFEEKVKQETSSSTHCLLHNGFLFDFLPSLKMQVTCSFKTVKQRLTFNRIYMPYLR